jgi:hypothetical protein
MSNVERGDEGLSELERRVTSRVYPHVSARPASVSLDDVEAAIWRLLAGQRVRRDPGQVAKVVRLVRLYGEGFHSRMQASQVKTQPVVEVETPAQSRTLPGEGARLVRETVSSTALSGQFLADEGLVEASKTCLGCGKLLPLSDFHLDRSNKTGVKPRCKQCARAAFLNRKAGHQAGREGYAKGPVD